MEISDFIRQKNAQEFSDDQLDSKTAFYPVFLVQHTLIRGWFRISTLANAKRLVQKRGAILYNFYMITVYSLCCI